MTMVSSPSFSLAISISEPPKLVELGLGQIHVRHAFVEILRHVLAAGGGVAYGGDRREDGFTVALIELMRSYERRDLPGPQRVKNYLAWPQGAALSSSVRADQRQLVTVIDVAAPIGAPPQLPPPDERSTSERFWAARAFTAMRQRMTEETSARLILGGRLHGQASFYPGVVEEAELTLRAGKPLYVVGGFGGASQAVAASIRGQRPRQLSGEYQREHTAGFAELEVFAARQGHSIDLEGTVETFESAGLAGLTNGLERDENEHLMATQHVDEIVALVLRGLRRLG
jgi:hypothetical protein